MNLNGFNSVAYSLTNNVSNPFSTGFDTVGAMAKRIVHLIRNLPKEMQEDPKLAFGTFAIANVLFFSTLSFLVKKLDKQIENQGHKKLNDDQRVFKVIGLEGILVGSSIFSFNLMLARLTHYKLNPVALTAITTTAIASRLLLRVFYMRGHLGHLLSENLPNFFNVRSSPTNWGLKTAQDLENLDRPLAARCVAGMTAALSFTSAVINLASLVTKVFVFSFAYTIGQIPAVKERTYTPLENLHLVSSNFTEGVKMLAYHAYRTTMFAIFSPLSCLSLGIISPSFNKKVHDWLLLTGIKQKDYQVDAETDEVVNEQENVDHVFPILSTPSGQETQQESSPLTLSPTLENKEQLSELLSEENKQPDVTVKQDLSEKKHPGSFVEEAETSDNSKPASPIAKQEGHAAPPPPPLPDFKKKKVETSDNLKPASPIAEQEAPFAPPPPPPPLPDFKQKKKVEKVVQKVPQEANEEEALKPQSNEPISPFAAELKRKLQKKESPKEPIDDILAQKQQQASNTPKVYRDILNHPMLNKFDEEEETQSSDADDVSDRSEWRLSGSDKKDIFTEGKKEESKPLLALEDKVEDSSPDSDAKEKSAVSSPRPLPPLPPKKSSPLLTGDALNNESKGNAEVLSPRDVKEDPEVKLLEPNAPKDEPIAGEAPSSKKTEEDAELKKLEAEEAALKFRALISRRRKAVGTMTPEALKKFQAKKAKEQLSEVQRKKEQRLTIIGGFTPEDVENAGNVEDS